MTAINRLARRAIEGENLDLFRQIKPNLSADEAKRLQSSFDAMDSHELELDIQSIAIEGDGATVKLTRRDVIVFGTMRQREMTGMSMGAGASTSKPIGLRPGADPGRQLGTG